MIELVVRLFRYLISYYISYQVFKFIPIKIFSLPSSFSLFPVYRINPRRSVWEYKLIL